MRNEEQQSRHVQLLAAGWSYDANSDMYTPPNAPKDGTARQHNQASAWQYYSTAQPGKPAQQRADPRRKEPE
jgi:hypothetical protein